jgi:hypothetical protein
MPRLFPGLITLLFFYRNSQSRVVLGHSWVRGDPSALARPLKRRLRRRRMKYGRTLHAGYGNQHRDRYKGTEYVRK